MIYFYSAQNNAFYPEVLREDYEQADAWPEDLVEITESKYQQLIDGQSTGKTITSDKIGRPILIEPVIDWNARAESLRESLLSDANNIIADWKIELQLEVISESDKARLIMWIAYIKTLKSLDLAEITDESSYVDFPWPEVPENVA